jgi:integrase
VSLVKKCRHDRSGWGRCGCAWYASLRDDEGVRRYTNLGSDRVDAQRRYALLTKTGVPLGGFHDAREAYLESCRHVLRPQSVERYRTFTKHADDWFGEAPLEAITGSDIVQMVDSLMTAGLAPGHVRTIRNLTIAILRHAQERGALESVPDVPRMKVGRDAADGDVQVFDLRVAEKIIAKMPEPERSMSTLMLWTGLRPSELVALTDEDVSDRLILVRKTAVQSTGGTNAPKTRLGKRDVDLSRAAREAAENLTFPVASTYKRWSERWRGAQAKARVPYVPLKTLRHTNASLRLAAGQSVPYVAQQLGHSPEILLSTYSHVIRRLGEDQVDLLDAVRQPASP